MKNQKDLFSFDDSFEKTDVSTSSEPVISESTDFLAHGSSSLSFEHDSAETELNTVSKAQTRELVPWIQRYTPMTIEDLPSRDSAEKLHRFVQDFLSSKTSLKKRVLKKKAILLYGPAGSCKTSSVTAVARSLGLELVETNASDVRNADAIIKRIGAATKQASLFGGSKLILIDEVDGVSGSQDRGGLAALSTVIKESSFPIVMTANDPWDKKFNTLRRSVQLLEFKPLDTDAVVQVLRTVCDAEHVTADELALKGLARRSGGDLRAALNDLQSLTMRTRTLTKEHLTELSDRDKEETIMQALVKVLKSTDTDISKDAFLSVSEPLDQCMLWLEENIPSEYSRPEDLARAFDALSRADVFFGRIRRQQHWRLLTYVSAQAGAGVALSKKSKYSSFVKYQKPQRILRTWILRNKYKRREALASSLGEQLHEPSRAISRHYLPYLARVLHHDPSFAEVLSERYDLDPDDIAWLQSQGATN